MKLSRLVAILGCAAVFLTAVGVAFGEEIVVYACPDLVKVTPPRNSQSIRLWIVRDPARPTGEFLGKEFDPADLNLGETISNPKISETVEFGPVTEPAPHRQNDLRTILLHIDINIPFTPSFEQPPPKYALRYPPSCVWDLLKPQDRSQHSVVAHIYAQAVPMMLGDRLEATLASGLRALEETENRRLKLLEEKVAALEVAISEAKHRSPVK